MMQWYSSFFILIFEIYPESGILQHSNIPSFEFGVLTSSHTYSHEAMVRFDHRYLLWKQAVKLSSKTKLWTRANQRRRSLYYACGTYYPLVGFFFQLCQLAEKNNLLSSKHTHKFYNKSTTYKGTKLASTFAKSKQQILVLWEDESFESCID